MVSVAVELTPERNKKNGDCRSSSSVLTLTFTAWKYCFAGEGYTRKACPNLNEITGGFATGHLGNAAVGFYFSQRFSSCDHLSLSQLQ